MPASDFELKWWWFKWNLQNVKLLVLPFWSTSNMVWSLFFDSVFDNSFRKYNFICPTFLFEILNLDFIREEKKMNSMIRSINETINVSSVQIRKKRWRRRNHQSFDKKKERSLKPIGENQQKKTLWNLMIWYDKIQTEIQMEMNLLSLLLLFPSLFTKKI